MPPSVWPGVSYTVSVALPTSMTSPSATCGRAGGVSGLLGRPSMPKAQREVSGLRHGRGVQQRTRAPVASLERRDAAHVVVVAVRGNDG